MNRHRKILLKRILSVFVPILILLVLAVVGTNAYFVHQMLHPNRRPVINTPLGYEQLLQKPIWDEITWTGARGQAMQGWLLYQDHAAPVIILSHGYSSNREEMLGPSFALWSAGFNVVAYDLRGHGASTADQCSLGPVELADLKATIEWAKTLKDDSGNALCDGRLGLYGADLGGFVSLSAAADEPAVLAVAVDTIYPTQDDYIKYQTKRLLGSSSKPGESWAEGTFEQSVISWIMGFMRTSGGVAPYSVNDAVTKMGSRPILYIQGGQDSLLAELSTKAAALVPRGEKVSVERSRAAGNSLFKEDAETYDNSLVAFFRTVEGLEPPPPSKATIDEQRKREAESRDRDAKAPAPAPAAN